MNQGNVPRKLEERTDLHQKVASVFSETAEYWEQIYDDNPDVTWVYRSQILARKEITLNLLSNVFGNRKLKILDAGCGPGLVMSDLIKAGHTVVGLDISHQMVLRARKRCQSLGKDKGMCILSDVSELPFSDNYFDVVVGLGLLEYVSDNRMVLKEFHRVLDPDGVVIICLPNILKLGHLFDPYFPLVRIPRLLKYRFKGVKDLDGTSVVSKNIGMSVKRFRYSSLDRIFALAGFQNSEIRNVGFGPFTFLRKEILPEKISLDISLFLQNRSNNFPWKWLKYFTNRWVILARSVRRSEK